MSVNKAFAAGISYAGVSGKPGSIPQDCFCKPGGLAVFLVKHDPWGKGKGGPAPFYTAQDRADCRGPGFGIKRDEAQASEPSFKGGEKLRHSLGCVNHRCGAAWLSGSGKKA